MFGFSLSKILFTLAAVVVVWSAFRWIGRVQARRRAEVSGESVGRVRPTSPASEKARRRTFGSKVEDLVACRVCGDFVPAAGGGHCGRVDCPQTE